MSVWERVWHRPWWWIDLVVLGVVGGIHVLTWLSTDFSNTDPGNKAGDGLRSACAAGLTVVGILLPVTLLVVQLASAKDGHPLPKDAVLDLLIAAFWFLLSLFSGLYVLFVAVTRGFSTSPLRRKDLGIIFGLQLILLIVGGERLVWGFATLAGSLTK